MTYDYLLFVCWISSILVFLVSLVFVYSEAAEPIRKAHRNLFCFMFGLYWLSVPGIVLPIWFIIAENYIKYETIERCQLLFLALGFAAGSYVLFARDSKNTVAEKTEKQE